MTTSFRSAFIKPTTLLIALAICFGAFTSETSAQSNGFVALGGNLFYEVNGNNGSDFVTLTTELNGDVVFEHYVNGVLAQSGEVEADDIALAELFSGLSFAGFLVQTGTGSDFIDNSALTNYSSFVAAGSGHDVIVGGQHGDELFGESGNDFIEGQDGNDFIDGGGGIDNIFGQNGDDVLKGGPGSDGISGGPGNDVLRGGPGADLLAGDDGFDDLDGEQHADRLIVEPFDVSFVGGSGFDNLYLREGTTSPLSYFNTDIEFINAARGVDYDLATRTITLLSYLNAPDSIDSSAYAGGFIGVTVSTGLGSDYLRGSNGNDALYAGADDDLVEGGPGQDFLDGGAGRDVLTYANAGSGVDIDMFTGFGFAGDAFGDFVINFEDLIGSDFSDFLGGDQLPNMILGGFGNDTIEGRNGDDLLYGQQGFDRILGGAGNDFIDGGSQGDELFGNSGNDSLFGRGGADLLNGGGGDDQQSGGAGEDDIKFNYVGGANVLDDSSLFGGSSDDRFFALNVGDPVNEFDIRSRLGDESLSDFEANDDDELVLKL